MRLFQPLSLLSGVVIATMFAIKHAFTFKSVRFIMALSLILSMSLSPILSAEADSTAASAPYRLSFITPSLTSVSTASNAVIPNCTPDNSYALPAPISPTQPGLKMTVDQPSTYTVYGDSPSQITTQMADCTPVHSTGTNGVPGRFAASTANAVSWDVTYNDVNDICSIASADVTIHINQVFPAWQAPVNVSSSLVSDWQTYVNKLHAYEQGHVNLDETYASKVFSDLNAISPEDCSTIGDTVDNIANTDLAQSLSANSAYDQTNGFGQKENIDL